MRARRVLAGFGHGDIGLRPTHPGGGASSGAGALPAQVVASRAREVATIRALCSDSHLRAPGARLTCTGLVRTDIEPCRTHLGASACSVLGGGAPQGVACGARQLVTFRVLSRRPDEEYGCHLEVSAVLQRTLESP